MNPGNHIVGFFYLLNNGSNLVFGHQQTSKISIPFSFFNMLLCPALITCIDDSFLNCNVYKRHVFTFLTKELSKYPKTKIFDLHQTEKLNLQ